MLSTNAIKELQRRIAVYDDEHAYRDLFTHFFKPLEQFAFTFIRSREQAEEIVSDVFIRIWEKRSEIEAIENLKVYLYVSVKNTALKYLQKQKKQAAVSLDELEVELQSLNWTPEELILTAEMVRKIEDAIQQLPPQCRLIFKLIKEDQLRYKEVAKILQISVKTIDNQIAIALKKINTAIRFDIDKAIRNN